MKVTLADMRAIGTVVETYAVDNNEYPPAKDIVDLKAYVEPIYIDSLPQFDSWGQPGANGTRNGSHAQM
jgi:hypothetical protein